MRHDQTNKSYWLLFLVATGFLQTSPFAQVLFAEMTDERTKQDEIHVYSIDLFAALGHVSTGAIDTDESSAYNPLNKFA